MTPTGLEFDTSHNVVVVFVDGSIAVQIHAGTFSTPQNFIYPSFS